MDKIEKRFKKWVGWIQGELLLQMQQIALDEYMFSCFEASLKPYIGTFNSSDIVIWIAKNHVGNICLAIRRFDDKDERNVSLRRLLIELRNSANIITPTNIERYCGIKCASCPDGVNVKGAVEHDLVSLDKYGRDVRVFVNTCVAHFASTPSVIPTFDVLRQAIDCYHTIYRKWAYILTGMAFQPETPNPMDLFPMIEEDYAAQFSEMWKHLFANPGGR